MLWPIRMSNVRTQGLEHKEKDWFEFGQWGQTAIQAELLYFNSCKHKKQEVHSACPDLSVSFIKLLRNPLLRV